MSFRVTVSANQVALIQFRNERFKVRATFSSDLKVLFGWIPMVEFQSGKAFRVATFGASSAKIRNRLAFSFLVNSPRLFRQTESAYATFAMEVFQWKLSFASSSALLQAISSNLLQLLIIAAVERRAPEAVASFPIGSTEHSIFDVAGWDLVTALPTCRHSDLHVGDCRYERPTFAISAIT